MTPPLNLLPGEVHEMPRRRRRYAWLRAIAPGVFLLVVVGLLAWAAGWFA
jgi:uncharacterized membrane protein (DUF485 family)